MKQIKPPAPASPIVVKSLPQSQKPKTTPWIIQMLRYADLDVGPGKFFDIYLKIAIAVQAITSISLAFFNLPLLSFLCYFGIPIIVAGLFWLWLIIRINARSSIAEQSLPDALQLMASNIRAGMTPDVALLLCAKPEFGALDVEIRRAAKEAMTGRTLEDALLDIPNRLKSRVVNRTFNLIVEGMRSGGALATLLEETSMDLRNSFTLLREVRANVMSYFIFILIAVGFGAPVLFGVSMTMVEVMTQLTSIIKVPENAQSIISIKSAAGSTLDPKFINFFVMSAISITVVFGSLTLGVIDSGTELAGLKYIIILAILCFGIFFGTRTLVSGLFKSMVPGF